MLHQRLTIPSDDAALGQSVQTPQPAARSWAARIPWMFTIVVVIPTVVAAIYFLISYPTAKLVEFVEAKLDIHRRPAVQGMRA